MTGDDLLAAIWAAPYDDEVRLVYADFLERTGDAARAELIQLQIALANMANDDPRRPEIEERERLVWRTGAKSFRWGLPEPLRSARFRRGFVYPLIRRVLDRQFFELMFDWLPLAPAWQIGLAVNAPPVALFASERLARIAVLRIDGPADLDVLARSPYATNLGGLGCADTRAPGEVIARLGALPHLRELWLSGCALDRGADLVAEASFARRLETLDVAASAIGADEVVHLFASGRFEHLAALDLSANGHGDAVVTALVARARLPRLARLRLVSMAMTTASAEALASWPGAATLRHLDLCLNPQLGAAAVQALVASPHLARLETLRITPHVEREPIVEMLADRFGHCATAGSAVEGVRRGR